MVCNRCAEAPALLPPDEEVKDEDVEAEGASSVFLSGDRPHNARSVDSYVRIKTGLQTTKKETLNNTSDIELIVRALPIQFEAGSEFLVLWSERLQLNGNRMRDFIGLQ